VSRNRGRNARRAYLGAPPATSRGGGLGLGGIYAQAGCFLLVSAWGYLRSLEFESSPGSTSARRYRWISVGALALSLLTDPLALSYVGILLLLDWYRPGRPPLAPAARWPAQLRALLAGKIPFLVVTAALLGLTLWSRTNVQGVGWKPPVTLAEFGVAPRFMQACYIWAYYLWKPLLPFHLSPFYTRLISFEPFAWEFVASLLVVGALTALFFWRRRSWPGVWLVWLCHLCVLIPVLGLTEHPHFASDRYSYVAAVPWSVAIAVVIVRLWPRRALRTTALSAAGLVIVALGGLSLAQTAVWRDTETLGLHMLAQMGNYPRQYDIYRRMSAALRDEGKVAESNAYFLMSLKGDPHAAEKALGQARRLEDEGHAKAAFAQYLIAAQLRRDLAEPRYRLGSILLAEDRTADALPFLQEAVRLEPGSADAQVTLGWALNRTNQAPEAIPHFETALRQYPDDAAAHSGLGVALVAIGHAWEAVPHFEQVIRLLPNSALAHYNLGLALLDGLGRAEEAAAQFEIALKLQPDYPDAREALARSRR